MCAIELFQSLTSPNLPDSPTSWFYLSILIVFNLLNVGLVNVIGGAFVKIMENFDITREETSRTISYYTIALAFSGVVVGAASHKFGPKKTLVLANAIGVGGCFGAAMVPVSAENLNYLSLCFFIYGLSTGLIMAVTFQLVAAHFVSHRGKAIMLYTFFSAVGLTIHPALYTIVLNAFGLRGSWMFYSCFLVQGFVPLYLFKTGKPTSNCKVIPRVIVEDSDAEIHLPNCLERADTTVRKDVELIRQDYQLRFVRSVRKDKCCDSCLHGTGNDENLANERLEIEAEERELLEACATNGEASDSTFKEPDIQEIQVCDELPEDKSEAKAELIIDKPRRLSETRRLSLRRDDETYYSSLKRLMTNYRVYAQLFCQMIGGLSSLIVSNTIVDYGMDTGLTFDQGNRFYVVMCVGSLVGLLPTGFFLDWKGMSDSLKMTLAMFKVVIAYALLSCATGWWLYLAAFLSGSSYAMSSTLRTHMASKFGLQEITTILGFGFFLNGCLQLTIPALIGICRDVYGSYYYLYVIISVSCLTVALLYLAIYINDRRIFIKRSTNPKRDPRPNFK